MADADACPKCHVEDGMHSFGCPDSRQQREQRIFGSGPNSIDPADRQDARCDVCDGSGEKVVNTDDSGDPMYDRAIDCAECGGKGFVDPFSVTGLNTTSFPVAPWVNERDERDESVMLVDFSDDFEWKQTVRPYGDGESWYVADWETQDYDGQTVWFDRSGFTISKELFAAINRLSPKN